MELITSGLLTMPEQLTPQAIYALFFHEYEKIQNMIFAVQVIGFKKSDGQDDKQKPNQQMQGMSLEVSDGIGTANILLNKEIMAQLELLKIHITENSVICLRGRISRQPCESGNIALILNECPRLILVGGAQVVSRIGAPIPLIKACEQNKYVDYDSKYPGNIAHNIPYSLIFR